MTADPFTPANLDEARTIAWDDQTISYGEIISVRSDVPGDTEGHWGPTLAEYTPAELAAGGPPLVWLPERAGC